MKLFYLLTTSYISVIIFLEDISNAVSVNPEDRLSLVSYDTNVYLNFPLRAMNKRNKKTALQEIKALQTGSSTNLCGGLMKGLAQIVNRGSGAKNEVASVLLFTDGLANHGIFQVFFLVYS